MKKYMLSILSVLLFTNVIGCARDGNSANRQVDERQPAVKSEPVTLKIYDWGLFSDEMFNRIFAEPVKKKHPHITLQKVTLGKDTMPETLIVGGNEVDLILSWNDTLPTFDNLELPMDLTALVKKHNINLSRFDQTNLQGIRDGYDPGKLYGLPLGYDFYATFYNKDIFDKFGIAYPKDGMTWDDAIELAKKVTRNENGIQYKGFDPEGVEKIGNSLSAPFVDPKTKKASLNTDTWRRVFELLKRFNDIPGNNFSITSHANTVKRFVKDQNVAMFASHQVVASMGEANFNWDIVQYPSFPDRMNKYGMVKTCVMLVPVNSKHPDEAMKVIDVLTSDEVQLALTKSAILITALQNPEMEKNLGADNPILKGKHIEGILKSKPAPFVAQTLYSGKARGILEAKYKDFIGGKFDMNTALREADEEANKYIDSVKK